MKKIRINELARELEVKPGVILDMLPELGVQEKKTHSSSVDEDVALELRRRITGSDAPFKFASGFTNGHHEDDDIDDHEEHEHANSEHSASETREVRQEKVSPTVIEPAVIGAVATPEDAATPRKAETPKTEAAPRAELVAEAPRVQAPVETRGMGVVTPRASSEPLKAPRTPFGPPIRTTFKDEARPPFPARSAPIMPRPPATNLVTPPQTTSAQTTSTANLSAGVVASEAAPETEKPVPNFRPLRPPMLGGNAGAIHPPLSSPAAPGSPKGGSPTGGSPASGSPVINRPISVPSRPVPSAPPVAPRAVSHAPAAPVAREPGTPGSGGLRQPMAAEPARPSLGVPAPPSAHAPPERPAPRPTSEFSRPQAPVTPVPPPSIRNPQQPPTHLVAPGPATQPGSGSPHAAGPPSAVPGAPRNPQPNRPDSRGLTSGLTPGSPIAPRPQGGRPLAGQPQARPVVPPRPDLVQRLKQQQIRPAAPTPSIPRPGTPARPSPAPGQPLYTRPPMRPSQPSLRAPSQPYVPGTLPPGIRRPGGPRPPHPTTLRPESAQPVPTEQQRRHTPKPGTRNTGRKREREEGNLRERVSKRNQAVELPPIDREITVAEGITVKELSEKLGVKANLVVKKLVEKKIFATINQTLDVKLAEELARDFGASTNQVSYEQEATQDLQQTEVEADFVRRAPVVTIMGHVDHGKTSLLDAIRDTNVAGREAGGITQHIGAYHIERNGRKIVFIDTPGHQAFTRMRARGAKITDIVVLVVSADDGVMPQTLEAIDHARAAGVPMIVAINKIDKPDAAPERVKQQLADRGLLAEDWGGDTVMTPVSAKTGQNLDLLLEMILLVADLQDLKANPGRPALGNVLEAKLDKGRGPVATMLVRNGTLRVGDFFICGSLFSKVRAMFDDRGNPVREAEPSMPVEVIGLEALPEVGDSFQVTSDTSKAKQIVVYREAKARDAAMAKGARVATLDSLHQQFKEGDLKDLNLIIKADVGGTAEVLSDTLTGLSTDKIRVRVLHAGVGAISESDVLLASTSEALIVGFNVKPDRSAESAAQQAKVEIRQHSIIYELIDEVKLAMAGLQDPVYKETIQGHVEVKEVFRISKVGTVAGCYVSDGLVRRDSQIRVKRDGDLLHTGKIEALKRFKNDASEVKNGIECGISLMNFNNIEVGDIFEAFTMERIMPELPVPANSR
jgi:translation initiation factor IF-2